MEKFSAVTLDEMEAVEGGIALVAGGVALVASIVGAVAKTAAVAKAAFVVATFSGTLGLADAIYDAVNR